MSCVAGCGSVWLERLVWDQEAAGSNPVTPSEDVFQGWKDNLSIRYVVDSGTTIRFILLDVCL